MASNVDIANAALTKIGARRIVSLADNTKEARETNSMFERIRDAELRARTWRFTIKRAQLAAQSSAPEFGYDYAYRPPADCLRILQAGDYLPGLDLSDYNTNPDAADYALENGLILTNYAAPLKLRYVARVEDPTLFDANFVEAFACKLAMELAEPITQSTNKRQLAQQEYQMAIDAAVRANAVEVVPVKTADDTWLLSRL